MAQNKAEYTISGYITEKGSAENLLGVTVKVEGTNFGAVSNTYGFYSLTLPEGEYTLSYYFIGFTVVQKKVILSQNLRIDVPLAEAEGVFNEVVVKGKTNQPKVADDSRMSVIDLPIKQIKSIPTLLGEKDVLKTIQLMPGVQSGNEGQSGFYVRGGSPDQNLIILDDAIVYNASHLFGFFSLFNGDALRSVELTKGGFPARYGGRLSSVLDMNMKEGNMERYTGEVGIGLISSRAVFEGPIPKIKKKGSFLISARRTYIDALIQPIILAESDGEFLAGYFFYDLNAKLNIQLTDKDRIYGSGYFGRDKFYSRTTPLSGEKSSASIGWGNATGTLRWNRQVNEKMFLNTSFVFSNYALGLKAKFEEDEEDFSMVFGSTINDFSLKSDLDYYYNPNHRIKMGFITTQHRFKPNALVIKASALPEDIDTKNRVNAQESGVYIEDDFKKGKRLRGNVGMRISHFYESSHYLNFEPRVSIAYKLNSSLSAKISYATMNQYIHLLANTGAGLPTDLWVPSTSRVKPQKSRQIAGGLAKDFVDQGLSLTLEGYFKQMDDLLGYREGASFMALELEGNQLTAQDWQDNVTSGEGWSYGTEVFLQKKTGDFSGWAGYTLSWTYNQFDELNNGKKFHPRYDRRHDVSVVGIYEINDHIKLSAVWVYGTGNALTVPTAVTNLASVNGFLNQFRTAYYYGDKNTFRMNAYHRMDFGIQFSREKPKGVRVIDFSVYNAYNRANPFYYEVANRSVQNPQTGFYDNETYLRQISLFPIIPSISYSFKFN